MTHTKDEAFKLVLEALKIARDQIVDPEYAPIGWSVSRLDEVLANGHQALAAPTVQDPVGWMHSRTKLFYDISVNPDESGLLDEETDKALFIYTTTPAAQPAPVTLNRAGIQKLLEQSGFDNAIQEEKAAFISGIRHRESEMLATPPAQPAPVQEHKNCALCGEDSPCTGTCGGGRDNPKALCYISPAAPVQEPNEADELLRHLGLDPQTYRTDGGLINRMKVKAALAHTDEYPRMDSMNAMVNRFLTWPMPASVYPDGTPGQPGRTGTNLLNASEARHMLEHVLATPPAAQPAPVPLTDEQIDALPWGPHEGNPMTFAEGLRDFARAIEAAHGITKGGAA